MKLIDPSVKILTKIDGKEVINTIASIARTCYKSEDKASEESDLALIKRLLTSGHGAMIEHYSVSVKFICSRAISHEIVRHRMASFAQESQRYCNYSKDKFDNEITFIKPVWMIEAETGKLPIAENKFNFSFYLKDAEAAYFKLLENGLKPQEARDVLPNATKTEINMTANLREWRHFFKLRCDKAAHPDMRLLAKDLLKQLHEQIPVIFDDLYEEFING